MGACGAGERPAPSLISKGEGILWQWAPRAISGISPAKFNFQGGGGIMGGLLRRQVIVHPEANPRVNPIVDPTVNTIVNPIVNPIVIDDLLQD